MLYGHSPIRVVLDLSPEISGEDYSYEPTTITVDLDVIWPADDPAAWPPPTPAAASGPGGGR
jgi:hypothetical protein